MLFRSNRIVLHEDDSPDEFYYQAYFARQTKVGMFYPLTACLLAMYASGSVDRNIFTTLAELNIVLPKERPVTALDYRFCPEASKPKTPEVRADPKTGFFAHELEVQGFRLTSHLQYDGRQSVQIGWLPKPGARVFFAGAADLRQKVGGVVAEWGSQGEVGVNRLLQYEFERLCEDLKTCLTPAGHRRCFVA